MVLKNRLFLTLTTIALGASLVGIANADTINSAMHAEDQQPAQYQTNMTQDNIDAMNDAMGIDITETTDQTTENNATQENNQDSATTNNGSFVMGPQNMTNEDSINQMNTFHNDNQQQMNQMYDSMQEVHENMPNQQAMGNGMNWGHENKTQVNTVHNGSGMGSSMGSGMMGR